MAISVTNQTKNDLTITNNAKVAGGGPSWEEVEGSWGEQGGNTWGLIGTVITNQLKNAFRDVLQKEDGGLLLLESGGNIVLEGAASGWVNQTKN